MWWDDIKNLTVSHIKHTACILDCPKFAIASWAMGEPHSKSHPSPTHAKIAAMSYQSQRRSLLRVASSSLPCSRSCEGVTTYVFSSSCSRGVAFRANNSHLHRCGVMTTDAMTHLSLAWLAVCPRLTLLNALGWVENSKLG